VSDLSTVDVVLVPVGGGGLASGVASAVKALRPEAKVFGVEPELAADARESLAAGRVVVWPTEQTYRTVADGLRTQLSELTLAHLTARLDGILTVSEEEILGTVGRLAREARLVVEPSGAVSVAGYLYRRDQLPPGRTVAVISGGNIAPALLVEIYEAFRRGDVAASKAGLIGFTRSLAREVASRGITVNAVAPGYIETPMTAVLDEKLRAKMIEQIPLGRPGTDLEIAQSVVFLASDAAAYITGHVLDVNGGMFMGG